VRQSETQHLARFIQESEAQQLIRFVEEFEDHAQAEVETPQLSDSWPKRAIEAHEHNKRTVCNIMHHSDVY